MSLPRQILRVDVEQALLEFGLRKVGERDGLVLYRNAEGRRVLLDYPERRVDVQDLRFSIRRAGLNEQAFLKALGDIVVPPDPR